MMEKTVTVTLEVREIVFDVRNKTHLTGMSRQAETAKNYEAASRMQATDDAESEYQTRRSVSDAIAAIKVVLGEYLSEDGSTPDNRIKEAVDGDGQVVLTFVLPGNYNGCASDSLGASLHDYVVDTAIFDWYLMTDKDDAATYKELAQVALAQAKMALYKRERPSRPSYNTTTTDP